MFQIDFLMEEFELVVSEEYKFEYEAKVRKIAFLEFSDCQDSGARNTNRQSFHLKIFYI